MSAAPPPPAPGPWRVLCRVLAETPAVRRVAWILAGGAAVTLGVQLAFDTAGRPGPAPILELLSVLFAVAGAALAALTLKLHGEREGPGLDEALLALPALGMTAGVLLGLAAGVCLARAVLGRPWTLVPAALFLGIVVLAARTVTRATRQLWERARAEAEAASRARAAAAEAHLAALRAQLDPHFLFNALNTIAALVATDARAAEATVENLSEVLRRTLERSRRSTGTVREEVEHVAAYLAVERQRWGEALCVEWRVPAETLDLPLPPMTLQPLVENAVKHGTGAKIGGGTIRIEAERADGALRLAVADDGPGFVPRHAERTGLGNLRERLAALYGDAASLTVEPAASGARVVLEIPVPPASPA